MREKDTGLYMELGTLGNYARNTAASLEISGKVPGRVLAAEVKRALKSIKAAVTKCAEESNSASGAREWLSDNWYIAEREGKGAAYCLKRAGRFPRTAGDRKRAAVSEAAGALVRSGRGEITPERLKLFLDEYQKAAVLSEVELAAFVPALKAELVLFLDTVSQGIWTGVSEDELQLLMKNIFTSLRLLSGFDVSDILESVNRTEETLRRDPAGIYPLMDEETRYYYRRTLACIAAKEKMAEHEAARKVLSLAQESSENHVGFYIFRKPLGKEKRSKTGGIYIVLVILFSLFFTVLAGITLSSFWVAALLLVPISEIVKNLADFIAAHLVKPKRLPRMGFENGLPKAGRTLCVISALLSGENDGKKCAGLLEEYRLLNRDAGENLRFGILADLPEAKTQETDRDKAAVKSAADEIERLNKEYGGGFYLFLRSREYNDADGCFMGRERKRGAILELVRLLTGKESTLHVASGDRAALHGTNYIITLDSDTRLTAGSAVQIVGTAMHPLNVPEIDGALGCVTSGYGILQPRVSVDLESANRSDFTKIFAGQGGIDPYGSAASEVYQDLFGLGTFTGKGLINVPVYAQCLDGTFPDNTVLSHDLLEGAYLRCGYLSDVELTDGYPYKVTSYYARMHRWTRGDWQNIRWLSRKVKNGRGELVGNPLGDVDKWKIFDNLRRSLTPVMTFTALISGMLIGGRAFAIAALVAAASAMSSLLISSAAVVLQHDGSTKARYHSTIISGMAGAIMQTLIRLMLLPAEAWTQGSAIVTAVYRMTVSHRNMLSWVTASDAEKKHGNTIAVNYLKLLACPIAGLFIMLLSRNAAAAAVGLVWMFTPAYAWALSRELHQERGMSRQDRSFLISCAADIWKYFDKFLCREDNFLPPDNFQEEPAVGTAHRTSPTNIGLAMTSALAAADLGLTEPERATELISKILTTVEKLPKWKGHLYNWYDTKTLEPLTPACVSSVDSGNLAACLIVIKEAAGELKNEDLRKRCEKLICDMSFRPLFDGKRKLFYIGWDVEKDKPTEGWYDLLASEARATSFIAVALGDVPRKHWRRLGRALVSQDNYSGMASWTGTMFEYLMPNLFLPCYKNSLLYESSRFCIYAQKRANQGIPWGISESAYYAFDPGLSYRYKAHGVQRLALKRKMGLETVVSPYSSFLALQLDPKSAVRNLRRIAGMGAIGDYGYYEALDFTPSRQSGGKYEIVRTYMVHHLGMSLVAIDNALANDIMPRRFMTDRRMKAYSELLQERVPTGEVVLRQPPREVPEKPKRQENSGYLERFHGVDAFSPRCLPISNGRYNVLLAENGKTRSTWQGRMLTYWEPDPLGKCGMELYLKTEDDVIPLLPAPEYRDDVEYASEFSGGYGSITAKYGQFCTVVTVTVPASGAGEIRTVDVSYGGKTPPKCRVVCAFEPVLERKEDFESHPAFSRLCLEAFKEEGSIVIRRRSRGARKEAFMCLGCDGEAEFMTSAGRGVFPESESFKKAAPEMRVSCSSPVIFKNGKAQVSFALCPADTLKEAAAAAKQMLQKKENQAISRIGASALMLGMSTNDVRRAVSRITDMEFDASSRESRARLIMNGSFGKESLWKFGISGDLPIMAATVGSEHDIEGETALLREHAFLHENGVECDIVLLLTDGSDYRCPQRRAALDFLNRSGREHTLGAKGGVHLVDAYKEGAEAILALADVEVKLGEDEKAQPHRERIPVTPKRYKLRKDGKLGQRFSGDGAFEMAMSGKLPPVAWSHILTNENFGFVATDAGTGHMWYKNARLMKINRWLNDPLTVFGTERIELVRNGGRISLFADGSESPALVTYGFGYAVWEKDLGGTKTRVTAFVPKDTAARALIIELDGAREGDMISYYTDLVLGEGNSPSPGIRTVYSDGVLSAMDPASQFANTRFSVTASREPEGYTTDRTSWLTGELDGKTGAGYPACIGAEYRAERELVIVTGCAEGGELRRLCDLATARKKLAETMEYWKNTVTPVRIDTPDKKLNDYINGWALYQAYACRVLARTALYQNGGAYGFRDQLQDVMALIPSMPQCAAQQIKLAAEHQYREGDVQHWWHPSQGGDKGIRTRCSDDLLWLPGVLCDYVFRTGDYGICRVQARYLVSEPLGEKEDDRYETPEVSAETGSILEHAKKAADEFIRRGRGAHGLALFGSGDWNDGMNNVGAEGKGESQWLTWFGAITLTELGKLCLKEGNQESAGKYQEYAGLLKRSAEEAWDGKWFLRGYYDDGTPLGSENSEECRIDSIAQSFAVFAGAGAERCALALSSAYDMLFSKENRIVKLFTPAFSEGASEPGYIKAYSPGFRENGGQYTHGAVWLSMAMFKAGMQEKGYELLSALLPGGRDESVYKAEPYVAAADVYSSSGNEGRGGWSWYTGAAGWLYRAATESLLGLYVREGRLFIEPKTPESWPGCSVRYKTGGADLEIVIGPAPERKVTVNGKPYDPAGYPLKIYNNFIFSGGNM